MSDQAIRNPGFYHRRVGDILVTAISDGYMDGPPSAARGLDEAEVERRLRENFRRSPPRVSINTFLVRTGGRTALVDTGSGNTMGPTMGRLVENLAAAGVSPDEIDTVLLTHMHPDHSNGLLDDDGRRVFENARVAIDETDLKHWHDDAAMSRATERQQERYFRQARHQIAPYRERVVGVKDAFPGVEPVPAPGHTPGHTGYLITSGADAILIWGDTVHWPSIQIPHPEVAMEYDTDPDAAAASRRRMFDMAASERLLVAGMHLDFPGFGYIVRREGTYGYVVDPWEFTPDKN